MEQRSVSVVGRRRIAGRRKKGTFDERKWGSLRKRARRREEGQGQSWFLRNTTGSPKNWSQGKGCMVGGRMSEMAGETEADLGAAQIVKDPAEGVQGALCSVAAPACCLETTFP